MQTLSKWVRLVLAFLITAILNMSPAPISRAANFTVPAGDVAGLIAAIDAANDEDTHPGTDTIVLTRGLYRLSAPDPHGGPNGLTGLPSITSDIIIQGNGAIIARDPNARQPFRIFHVAAQGKLEIEKLTVRNGLAGSLDPFSAQRGGGIAVFGGQLVIKDSTISNNAAGSGGGIDNIFGSVTIINSTVSGNQGGLGGGIHSSTHNSSAMELKLINSTVAFNQAGFGGGIYNFAGTVEVVNTIIAHNRAEFSGGDCAGNALISLGHNLDGDGACELNASGDIPSSDPLLCPLKYFGGPTQTHALLPNSPAIGAGDPLDCPSADQRGIPRPGNAACTIGAYEFDVPRCAVHIDPSYSYRSSKMGR
jgi:hypothetical protein